jgi:hypothetical protein
MIKITEAPKSSARMTSLVGLIPQTLNTVTQGLSFLMRFRQGIWNLETPPT